MGNARRWLVSLTAMAVAVGGASGVRAVEGPIAVKDTAALFLDDPLTRKLGVGFREEIESDPEGFYYDLLLSVGDEAEARAVLPEGRAVRFLPHVGVARVVLSRAELLRAVGIDAVQGVEPNRSLELMNAGARRATGVDDVQRRGDDGTYGGLTGERIHVAVIDSGLDTTHPDFAGRIEHAWEIVSTDPQVFVPPPVPPPPSTGTDGQPVGPPVRAYVGSHPDGTKVEVDFTDAVGRRDVTVGGLGVGFDPVNHGTHVAGIVAGGGVVNPANRGVAPGSRLHTYKFGNTAAVLAPASMLVEAYEHIVAHNTRSPEAAIRVVNMSIGGAPTCDADAGSLVRPIQKAMYRGYKAGIVITVAYGNSGSKDGTCTIQSQMPWIVGVGNAEKGGRLAVDSSRGRRDAKANYDRATALTNAEAYVEAVEAGGSPSAAAPLVLDRPGVSAPGTRIVSTMGKGHPSAQPGAYGANGPYGMLSGTSMAAPHVAGIATLVVEAFRSTHGRYPQPIEVIEILEATADRELFVTDPDTKSPRLALPHEMGAGMADAALAVAAAKASADSSTSRPAAAPVKTVSSSELGTCEGPVTIGSVVTDQGFRTCKFTVPPGARSVRVEAVPEKPGDFVAVRLGEDACPACGDLSTTIVNTSKPVTGRPYDVLARRPASGPWTVRFDGVPPGPGTVSTTALVPYRAFVTFEFYNRAPTASLRISPPEVDGAPVVSLSASLVDADGAADLAGALLAITDATGHERHRFDLVAFAAAGADERRLDLDRLRLRGTGPWTVELRASDIAGATARETATIARV